MIFIKITTCYAQHRSKGIHQYIKVLIVNCSCYHGYRKKEQPNSSVLRDSRLSWLCRGIQLYPNGRTGLTTIPRARGKGCLTSPNISLVRPECLLKGSSGFPVNVLDIPDQPRINRSQLVTWLVDPIGDIWSVRVVTRTYVSQYMVLTAPWATSPEIPYSRRPTPRLSKISKLSSRLPY
jgi:hypothetical protein